MSISTILRKFTRGVKFVPVLPVALLLGLGSLQFTIINLAHPSTPPDYTAFNEAILDPGLLEIKDGALVNEASIWGELTPAYSDEDFAGFAIIEKASFLNSNTALSNAAPSRNGLLVYRVGDGDTLSTIAAEFGISMNTVLWANNLKSSNLIQSGQEIVLLPVSGVLHEIRSGDTLDSIAALYDVSSKQIATYNKRLVAGEVVVVPNAKPVKIATSPSLSSSLPDVSGYLSMPIKNGWNWGRLHSNAVDISAACGTSIYAAAEGIVVETASPARWNSGFGGFIRIRHSLNGIETLYAHNSENLVSEGDAVLGGDLIAKVGDTGRVQGTTGCHIHFGVFGAQHPFVKY